MQIMLYGLKRIKFSDWNDYINQANDLADNGWEIDDTLEKLVGEHVLRLKKKK